MKQAPSSPDFQEIWQKIKYYMSLFWQKLSFYWKKFHMTKVTLILILSVGLVISTYMAILAKSADVETLQVGLEQTTVIKDRQGEDAGTLYSQKGTYIPLDQISENISRAVIATEDRRFYDHHGFDIKGIARAALSSLVKGRIAGGGSTITQQLAKNAYLSADQTLTRKLRELFLAIEIEKHYSKDQILEMYLNHAYFGSGVWGVEDASRRYFGKSASEVTIQEAAVLAGILKAPSLYNPIENYEQSIARRNVVLQILADTGQISQDEADQLAQTDIALANTYSPEDSYRYPYYFDAVIEEASERYGIDEDELVNNGYTIYTALDQNYQQMMDQAFAEQGVIHVAEDGVTSQSASVALDPRTGGINALVGGSGEYTYRGYNRATQMRRQPASVIKPLGVYTPALEEGYEPDSIVKDELLAYGKDNYMPENVNFEYEGELPMYEALAKSKNTSAVWLLNKIGLDKGYQKIKEFGLKPTKKDYNLGAVALGGMDRGATLVEIAAAYGTFANDGVRNEPHLITKIVDASGAVIVNNEKPETKRVVASSINKKMNQMLLYVYDHPWNAQIKPDGYEIAGKTGTSEAPGHSGAADQWVVGYTPDVAVVSWAGFDETDEVHNLPTISLYGVGQLLKTEMTYMLPYSEQTSFDTESITPPSEKPGQNLGLDSEMGKNIRKGLEDFGNQVRKGADQFLEDASRWWNSVFGQ